MSSIVARAGVDAAGAFEEEIDEEEATGGPLAAARATAAAGAYLRQNWSSMAVNLRREKIALDW